MKIDGPFYAQLGDAAKEARRLASIGYDGVYTLEGSWDPFLRLVMAAEHEPALDIATGIAAMAGGYIVTNYSFNVLFITMGIIQLFTTLLQAQLLFKPKVKAAIKRRRLRKSTKNTR